MYKLPKDFNPTLFIGHELEMICFNQNQLNLHFDKDLNITIESAFQYSLSRTSPGDIKDVPVLESNLMQLLGQLICDACGDEEGTLTLIFNNGHVFKCFDTSEQYESYQINYQGKVIIV